MSQLTNYGENLLADFIRGQGMSLPTSFHIGLLSDVSDSTYTEVSWMGYARQESIRSALQWSGTQFPGSTLASTGTSHQTSNNAAFDFGEVGVGGAAGITHVGLFAGSDLFAFAQLSTPMAVSEGDPVSIAAGAIVWTLGLTGGLSDYFSNKLIDLVWRGRSFGMFVMPATMFARLFTTVPSNAGGGTEVSGAGYARPSIASSMAAWSGTQGDGTTTASTGTGGRISNNADLVFPGPGGDWGTVGWSGFNDAPSGGNLLFWVPLGSGKTISAGGPAPRFSAGSMGVTFA